MFKYLFKLIKLIKSIIVVIYRLIEYNNIGINRSI